MKYGVLISLIWLTIKFQITKDLDINSYLLISLVNTLGLLHKKNKNSQTIANECSNILTTSKRTPLKIESDRGAEFIIVTFKIF